MARCSVVHAKSFEPLMRASATTASFLMGVTSPRTDADRSTLLPLVVRHAVHNHRASCSRARSSRGAKQIKTSEALLYMVEHHFQCRSGLLNRGTCGEMHTTREAIFSSLIPVSQEGRLLSSIIADTSISPALQGADLPRSIRCAPGVAPTSTTANESTGISSGFVLHVTQHCCRLPPCGRSLTTLQGNEQNTSLAVKAIFQLLALSRSAASMGRRDHRTGPSRGQIAEHAVLPRR